MIKITRVIFIISVLLLSLAGCAETSDKVTDLADTTTECSVTESQTKQQNEEAIENLSDNEAIDTIEETKEMENAITTETVVGEELPKAYDMILNNIYDALQLNPVTDEINSVYFSTGINEVVLYGNTVDDRMKAVAYCIMDVNKDGVEELLIVDPVYPQPGNVRIIDMYTLVDGTPVKVIEGWARNGYYLLDDGTIYCVGSGGAAYSNVELLSFEPIAIELTLKELYFTYPKDEDMNNVGYYYSGSGIYDVSVATEISADEFQYVFNDFENRQVIFDAKTFDSLK